MAITDSRLGPGTMTVGATPNEFTCQVTNARLTPTVTEGEVLATLCDINPVPTIETDWSFDGTVIQDWELPDGFVEYARTNTGTTQPVEFTPSTAIGVVYGFDVQVRPMEIGGDVNKQLTSDFTWPVVGAISRTEPAAP